MKKKTRRRRKRPPVAYQVLTVLLPIFVLIPLLFGGIQSNRDTRKPKEMARDFFVYRGKYIPSVRAPTEANITELAGNAMCLLGLMGHPLATGGKFVDSFTTTRDEKEYTYVRFPNLWNNYTYKRRVEQFGPTVKQLKAGKLTKAETAWFTYDPDEFLRMPTDCARRHDGSCYKALDDDRDCFFIKPLADQITLVSAQFYQDKKRDFRQPIVCFRTNLHQATVFADTHQCEIEDASEGLMPAGHSHHGMALAWDLPDKEAWDYLAEIGMACAFIGDDEAHCSFGETDMNKHLVASLLGKGKRLLRKAGKVYKFLTDK